MNNTIVRLTVFLLLVAGLSGLAVGYTNGITAPVIAVYEAEKLMQGYADVYHGADEFAERGYDGPESIIYNVVEAKRDGEAVGLIYTLKPRGFGGEMTMLAGVDFASQKITGIRVLSHAETPGLGDRTAQPGFAERFAGKTAARELSAVGAATSAEDEVQGVTGATVSTEAVAAGVNAAIRDANSRSSWLGGSR